MNIMLLTKQGNWGIPTVCLADTDCDPDLIDICVPGNDDAIRSINLFLTKTTDAILAAKELLMTITSLTRILKV